MAARPTIVVVAHARPAATQRLFDALHRADVAVGTELVVSIDVGAASSRQVVELAEAVDWPHGTKTILTHDSIGLVGHFHACGDLTEHHGDVVLLEDDLVVAPGFHRWAAAALDHGRADDRIAGVSLSAPGRDGYRHLPFEPVNDGSDVVYAQVPWYDGMAFTAEMWKRYRSTQIDATTPLHRAFGELGADEWFPTLTRYLVQTERWWLMPRSAQATGTGAPGAHFDRPTDWFQVPLAADLAAPIRFVSLDDSRSRYDDHLEPCPAMLQRLGIDAAGWTIDLGGTRAIADLPGDTPVLTTRPSSQPIRSWGASMHPMVMNLVHDEAGDDIHLAPADSIDRSPHGDQVSLTVLTRHHRRRPLGRAEAMHAIAPRVSRLAERLRRG